MSERESPAAPRAIVFDFDGVIADTEWLHSECFRSVLGGVGIDLAPEDVDGRFLGLNDRTGFEKALLEAGRQAPAPEVLSLVALKSRAFSSRLAEVRLFPGAKELVEALAARRPLAIASGGRKAEIEWILEAHGLRPSFRAVLSSDDVARSKPSPEPYLAAVAALGRLAPLPGPPLAPGECLAIEDSLPGLRAAKAAGLRTIAVLHSYPRDLLAGADRIVERISDLRAEEILDGL